MKKRGTGWIPDYPEIKDYTLNADEIQNLTNKVQSQGVTASIEDLTQKIYETLADFIDSQSKDKNQLTQLRDNLEAKILGDLRFVTVELHSVIEPGMADSEVLLIKNYLQRIISTWMQFKNIDYPPDTTNTTFDPETQKTVNDILKTQKYLQVEGYLDKVDKDDMEALTQLAYGIDLDRNLEPFMNLMKINSQKYQPEIAKYTAQNNPFPPIDLKDNHEQFNRLCQGLLTVYFFPVIENLRELNKLFSDMKPEAQQMQKAINSQQSEHLEVESENPSQIVTHVKTLIKNVDDIKKDRDFIQKILEEFQESLTKEDVFKKDELRDLTDITSKGKGLDDKIIKPLDNLWKKSKDFNNIEEIKKVLFKTLKEFERMMGLLYMAYPPEIPSEIFQRKEMSISPPIPDVVVELFKSKLAIQAEKRESTLSQQLIDALINNSISDEILQSFGEILAQILMPLGQYSNLNEAVKQGLEIFLDLLVGKQDNNQEIRGLIRETIEEYNFGMAKNYSLMMELNLQDMITTVVEKFNQDIKQREPANKTNYNQEKSQNSGAQKQPLTAQIKPINQIQKLIKKPLFEITNLEPISSNQKNLETNNSQKLSQPKNILQFPISSQIRQQIKALEKQECTNKSIFLSLPEFVDLTYWCSPVEDQGKLNSCTAHAGVALMEYAEKKSSDSYTDASPLFLYQVTRNLMQREGDSGASVRDTMKAMVAFGVCPEEHWPYNEDKLDEEPTAFCYSFAENYKTIKYFRLDYGQISRYTLLSQVKVLLASEIPCIFGFTLYNSVYDEVNVLRGHIPLPNKGSKVIGGHTVVAVGYHDRKMIENENRDPSKGALLIRNSWGTSWGQGGYGWLPYDYIMEGLTADWWSLLKSEWLATGRFGAGASAWNADKGDKDAGRGHDQ